MIVAFFINVFLIFGSDKLMNIYFSNVPCLAAADFGNNNWIAIPAFVLGTLLIVISIASQSLIKLIDLFMEDWVSLLFVWFIILAATHYILIYGHSSASMFLNIDVFLVVSIILTFPYVFYILRLTKPDVIISNIETNLQKNIDKLVRIKSKNKVMTTSDITEFQLLLFSSLNQLDDLINNFHFKETKALILSKFRKILEYYLLRKALLPRDIFSVTEAMKTDISFRTMFEFLKDEQEYVYFFEKKCLRIMNNVYTTMLENNQFDMASLTMSEIVLITSHFSEKNIDIDDNILDLILVHFNTFFRYAFKHAIKQNEQRNLYNLVYHYRLLVENFVKSKNQELLLKSFFYFQYYGNECYKQAKQANLFFIVDTIAFEMKQILVAVFEHSVDRDAQKKMLVYFLKVDNPPEFLSDSKDKEEVIASKVRLIQISLGLFYLQQGEQEFVDMIIEDILEDVKFLGVEPFRKLIERMFSMLETSGSSFWEDTDRGNINIYFTAHKEMLEIFKADLFSRIS